MPILRNLKEFFRKGDVLLLFLCLTASACSLVLVYSATRWSADRQDDFRKQVVFIALGVAAYIIFTFVDIELILDKCWVLLFLLSVGLILMLKPFGVTDNTGNRNWMYLPGIPFGIQPAEVVKLFFVLLLGRIINRSREWGLSRAGSVMKMAAFTLFFMALNTALSSDFGMSLVYLAIFVIMAFAAGVKLRWFVLGGTLALGTVGGVALAVYQSESLWRRYGYIIRRFTEVFTRDDPQGVGWQQTRSLIAIGSGELTGMGWLQGKQTQSLTSSSLPARHTDFIFAVCGEEFGLIGCCVLLLVLLAVILRCVHVSRMARDHLSAYVALGFAGMLMVQIIINVGMCLYVVPVVGLTLPFISYGGSSVLTLYACMGIVSGIKMRTLPSWIRDRSKL